MNWGSRHVLVPVVGALLGTTAFAMAAAEQATGQQAASVQSSPPAAAVTEDTSVLAEVVVTAEKRPETNQKVPISLVSLNSEELADLGISSVADLAHHVPSLSMTPFPNSPNSPRLVIRGLGIGESQITSDGSVGVYVDGVYLARGGALGLDVADLDRIEVLRGPQGTLYGRNTTGGALNLVTSRPTNEFSVKQDLSVGDFSYLKSKTVVNVPITQTLYAKVAFDVDSRDGPVRNLGVGHDFGSYDKTSGRADLRWVPTDSLTVDYSFDRALNDFTGYYYQLIRPNAQYEGVLPVADGRLGSAALPSPYLDGHSMSEGHTLTTNLKTALGDFRTITGYREMTEQAYQDYSANSFLSVFQNLDDSTRQHQFSEEFQLIGGSSDNTLRTVLGLYYFRESGSQHLQDAIGLYGIETAPVQVSAVNKSVAAYAQGTWKPSPQNPWAFTLGARFTEDDRSADNGVSAPSKTFNKVTPSAIVAYEPSEAVNLYGKVVTGYKSGGFNIRQTTNFDDPYGPESLITYELGAKTEWLNRRLRVNGAVFYSDYTDLQLDLVVPNQPNPGLSQTQNAGKATISGIEVNVDWAASADWLVSVGYSLLDTQVKEVVGDDRHFWHLPNAPRNQVNASVKWDVWRWSGNLFTLSADYTYRDSVYTSPRPNPPGEQPGDFIPAYALAGFRAAVAGDNWIGKGHFEVSAWVTNAFNKGYYVDGQGSFYQLTADQEAAFGDPLRFGLDLRYRF